MKTFFKTSLVSLFLLVLLTSLSQAAPPAMINYQGIVTDIAGDPIDGPVDMVFAIYDSSTDGNLLWSENQPGISVNNGLYNIQLGSVQLLSPSLFTDPGAWLEITVAGETLTPRQQITSVLYSLRAAEADNAATATTAATAGNAGTVDGYEGADLEESAEIDADIATHNGDSGAHTGLQRRVAGTCAAGSSIRVVNADGSVTCETGGTGSGGDNLGDHTATQNIYLNGNWLSGDGGNEGAYVDNDGNVGIGTASPASKLEVAGAIQSTTGGFVFPDGTAQNTAFGGTSVSHWEETGGDVWRSTGNVGIGTASPAEKLDVNGNVKITGTGNPLVVRAAANGFGVKIRETDDGNDAIELIGYSTRGSLMLNSNGVRNVQLDASPTVNSYINAGNVGIGTTSPGSKLDVNGTVTATAFSGVGSALTNVNAGTVDGMEGAALEESAEIDADIAAHGANASAHHAKTSTFPELSGQASDAQIPAAIARDSEIMSVVLASDGTGSALDADLLDGQHAADIITAAADEVRTPISSCANDDPTGPGSYYLTGNLTATGTCLTINYDDVTIDLMGFTITGPDSGTNYGVDMSGRSNVEIKNGTIRDFATGIYDGLDAGQNHRVTNIRAMSNINDGIYLYGHGHQVRDSIAADNGSNGIYGGYSSTITGNTAYNNGSNGITVSSGSTITGNTAYNNGSTGIYGGGSGGSTITGNTAYNNGSTGIYGGSGSTITGNTAYNNGSSGIYGGSGSTITGNTARSNQIYGIHLSGNSLADGNTAYDNNQSGAGYTNISSCGTCTFGDNNGAPNTISSCVDDPAGPGSYYLTGNLTATGTCLTINYDDVTIDLMGFTITGPDSGTNYGVDMSGRSNVEIKNGTIRDFATGIFDGLDVGQNHRVTNIRAMSNTSSGIYLRGRGHQVRDSIAADNGSYGIYGNYSSTITGNTAYNNGSTGINVFSASAVTGNIASNNGNSGIYVSYGSTITGNTAYNNGSSGIYVSYGSTITGNTARFNQNYGIYLGGNDLVDGNTAYTNNQSGGSYTNISSCGTCTFGLNHAP